MGPLDGCMVIELAGDRGMFAGKLLHDMGAGVVRIELPGQERKDPEHIYCNAGKRRMTLDPDSPEGKLALNQLLKRADVLVEDGRPGELVERGLGYEDLRLSNPGIIYISITDFGQTGPRSGERGSDAEMQAASGWLSVTGEPDRPLVLPGNPAFKIAGMFAANGALLALLHRHETGAGQQIDISIQECAAAVLDHVLVRQAYTGETARRQVSLHWNNAFRVFPCRDGYILLSIHRQWETLVEWMGSEGMAGDLADEKYRDEAARNAGIGHIIDVIEDWTRSHTTAELEETGQLMRFPWSRVLSVPELLKDEHLDRRQYWSHLDKRKVPGAPVRMSGSPWRSRG